jgi:hypothetical protein
MPVSLVPVQLPTPNRASAYTEIAFRTFPVICAMNCAEGRRGHADSPAQRWATATLPLASVIALSRP